MANLHNFYYNNLRLKLSDAEYWDLYLANDERCYTESSLFTGITQDGLISCICIDNPEDLEPYVHIIPQLSATTSGFTLYSNCVWDGAVVGSGLTVCDIGLTGIDSGFVPNLSGETFSPSGDTRLCLRQVFPTYGTVLNNLFTGSSIEDIYKIDIVTGDTISQYAKLCGGFFQGFFKLHDYDYQVWPEKYEKGWTSEFWLLKESGDTCLDLSGFGDFIVEPTFPCNHSHSDSKTATASIISFEINSIYVNDGVLSLTYPYVISTPSEITRLSADLSAATYTNHQISYTKIDKFNLTHSLTINNSEDNFNFYTTILDDNGTNIGNFNQFTESGCTNTEYTGVTVDDTTITTLFPATDITQLISELNNVLPVGGAIPFKNDLVITGTSYTVINVVGNNKPTGKEVTIVGELGSYSSFSGSTDVCDYSASIDGSLFNVGEIFRLTINGGDIMPLNYPYVFDVPGFADLRDDLITLGYDATVAITLPSKVGTLTIMGTTDVFETLSVYDTTGDTIVNSVFGIINVCTTTGDTIEEFVYAPTAPPTSLNDIHSGNTGIFYYLGTRSENKYCNPFSGETGLLTCEGNRLEAEVEITEVDIANEDGNNPFLFYTVNQVYCEGEDSRYRKEAKWKDCCEGLVNNALGFRIADDCSIGYRLLTQTGECVDDIFTYTPVIQEEYTEAGIVPFDEWFHVAIKYSAENTLEDCELELDDGRTGTLSIYVNGLLKLNIKGFPEFIPHELDEIKDKQAGVPFNVSIGGGTLGLTQSMTFDPSQPFGVGVDPQIPQSGFTVCDYCSIGDPCESTFQGISIDDIFYSANTVIDSSQTQEIIDFITPLTNGGTVTAGLNCSGCGNNGFEICINGTQSVINYYVEEVGGTQISFKQSNCFEVPISGGGCGLLEENFSGSFIGCFSKFRHYIKPLCVTEIRKNYETEKPLFGL